MGKLAPGPYKLYLMWREEVLCLYTLNFRKLRYLLFNYSIYINYICIYLIIFVAVLFYIRMLYVKMHL